jgi:MFS transporter, DHA2 family, multidrug resistance protein
LLERRGAELGALVNASAAPRAGWREWFGLAVISLPCLLVTMDLTVLYLATPNLSADLDPTSSQLLWILDVYGFVIAGSLVTMGTLGDRIGRRRLLLIGAAAFGVASVLAAFSWSARMLIAARALLGVAGATLAPSTLSLIRNMFAHPDQRALAVGVWVTSFSAGAVIGPLAGGALLQFFWWGSVFLLAVPAMALLLATGPLLLPEYRDPGAGRLDLPSAALSLAAVLAVVFGLKRIAQDGMGSLPALSVAAGLALGATFVLRQRRLADPLMDLGLFRIPALSASLAAITIAMVAMSGTFLFSAQYLQLVLGLSPLRAGLWTVPQFVGLIVGSMLAPLIARRVRRAVVAGAGLTLAAVGFGTLTQVDGASGLAVLVTGSVVFSLGLAPVFALGTDMVVGAAPPERAGAASGLSETGNELGGALGIAILGSVGTAVYRHQIADALPADAPSRAAATARDTLGGAVGAANRLGDPLASRLLDAAREAFAQALHLTAAVSAAIVLGMAVVALTLLRDTRAGSETGGPTARGPVGGPPTADAGVEADAPPSPRRRGSGTPWSTRS